MSRPENIDNGRRIEHDWPGISGLAGFVERGDDMAELAYLVDKKSRPPVVGSRLLVEGREWIIVQVDRPLQPSMHILKLKRS